MHPIPGNWKLRAKKPAAMPGCFRLALQHHFDWFLLLWIVAGDRDRIVGRTFCSRRVLDNNDFARVRRDCKRSTVAENRKRRMMFRRADVDLQIAGTIVADREARGRARVRCRFEVQGMRRYRDLTSPSRSRGRGRSCRLSRSRSGGRRRGPSCGGGGSNGWRCGCSRRPSRGRGLG